MPATAFAINTVPLLSTSHSSLTHAICTTPVTRRFAPRHILNTRSVRLHAPPIITTTTVTMAVKEGDTMPSFNVTDTDGNAVSSDTLRGSKLVLYFSNAAGPGCVSQSCSFRDAEAQFQGLDARIIAVSAQAQPASAEFKRANGLTFPVVADKERVLQKLFGVPTTFGLLPGRVTYVMDRDGVVVRIYNSQFSAGSHVGVAKEVLNSIN